MSRFSVLFAEKIITSCHMQMKIIRLAAVMEIFNSTTVAMPTAPLQKTMERLSSLFSPSMTNSAAAIFNYRSSSAPHPPTQSSSCAPSHIRQSPVEPPWLHHLLYSLFYLRSFVLFLRQIRPWSKQLPG